MGEAREVWAKRIERLTDSGLTVREFAAEIGVNANTLAAWKWRLATDPKRAAKAESKQSPAPTFLELVTTTPERERGSRRRGTVPVPVAEPFEIVLQGGIVVRVPVRFDPAALCRLVDALEAR